MIEKLQRQVSQQSDNTKDLHTTIDKLCQELKEAKFPSEEILILQQEIEAKKLEMKEKEQAISSLQASISQKQQEIASKDLGLKELENKLKRLELENSEKDKQISQYEEVARRNQSLESKLKHAEEQLASKAKSESQVRFRRTSLIIR